jgi:radical SAM superfamily enzyme YgiQ (UPF0313 family)
MRKGKNILFISANRYSIPNPVYPLGISYLKTYLEKNLSGFNIEVFDFNCSGIDDFRGKLKAMDFSYLCFSLRNIDDTNIYSQKSFIEWYKEIISESGKYSNARIIVGGAGFSIFPGQLFNDLSPHYGIQGEGEKSLFQLISCLEAGLDERKIEGLVFRDDDKIVINERSEYINSPDIQFEENLIKYYWDNGGMMNIQTKRGCPYRCIYCSYPIIEGSKVRTFDPEKTVDGIERLKQSSGVDYIFFTDSVFNIQNNYNIELCEQILKKNLKIRWGAYFSHCNFEKDELAIFKSAGLTHIEFGTDSLSDSQLENYRKNFSVRDILKNSQICIDQGIFFAHFLILGGYGETEETLKETFENSKLIDRTVYFPFVGMRIYPHTELYERASTEKVITCENEILDPIYYISAKISVDKLKEDAYRTGKRWIFPDFNDSAVVSLLRRKKRRGPLWEYLRK